MAYNPEQHHRRSIRLKEFDYSQSAIYFITICIQDRKCLLGSIEDNRMLLSDPGNLVLEQWLELPIRFPSVIIDQFVIMPNHLSKDIAKPNSLIGLENLTGIRDRTKTKSGKRASKKQRRANRNKAKWSFAQLHGYIDYKANLIGSLATKVPAHYTSQSCPKCGHTSKGNRPNKGLLFRCECCAHEIHSDLAGARNIAMRTLLVRQDWMSTGALSVCPDVSRDETKAEILRRFSELRWSVDTSQASF